MTVNAPEPQDLARDAATLRDFLADRDTPCPGCGYNLRGLTARACPECNSDLTLTVGLAEPKQAALLAGAIALGAGIGFNGLILLWVAWMIFVQRRGGPSAADVWSLPAGLVLCSLALWVWLRARRRLRRTTPTTRWTLAALAAALTLATAITFFATVR